MRYLFTDRRVCQLSFGGSEEWYSEGEVVLIIGVNYIINLC